MMTVFISHRFPMLAGILVLFKLEIIIVKFYSKSINLFPCFNLKPFNFLRWFKYLAFKFHKKSLVMNHKLKKIFIRFRFKYIV